MNAKLALEDGTVFAGQSVGVAGTRTGEVVFNTGMTGYQEVFTDPSYCGQIVTMTFPLQGKPMQHSLPKHKCFTSGSRRKNEGTLLNSGNQMGMARRS